MHDALLRVTLVDADPMYLVTGSICNKTSSKKGGKWDDLKEGEEGGGGGGGGSGR